MSDRKLPDGAYDALEGLKAQADAAMMTFPTNDAKTKAKGKKALAVAHDQIAANEQWAKKIHRALIAAGGELTVVSVDTEWLERTFSADVA